jgi:tRNA A-37 threonylcarbamoyl transferase component Bud32
LKGIENEDDTLARNNLGKSKRLYEFTFRVHAQLTETDLFLTLALLNNLSLANKALNNQYEADRWDQRLLHALLRFVDRRGALTEENKRVLDGFMSNVMQSNEAVTRCISRVRASDRYLFHIMTPLIYAPIVAAIAFLSLKQTGSRH